MRTLIAIFLSVLLASHARAQPLTADPLGELQQRSAVDQLQGRWRSWIGPTEVTLAIAPDGTFSLNEIRGSYKAESGRLVLNLRDRQATYTYKFDAGQLTLSGEGIANVVFIRQAGAGGFLASLIDVSWNDTLRTLYRIGLIVLVAVLCRLVVMLVRMVSHWILFSPLGPTRFLANRHRHRAMTVHALILNGVKYVVYFTALGFILNELGINTTTYLASLSVIGLAIGFGSQGLVQDMVTGFFIIFEGQFDVGDMVEISGQSGVVVDLGLRMTKLRNFVGQVVVIPNRNIAVVANFSRGALMATVEASIAAPERVHDAEQAMLTVAQEIERQFQGIVVRSPELVPPLALKTGEQFARISLGIWPGQQWVIDAQLIPRLRDTLQKRGIALDKDRVAAHYFPPRETTVSEWSEAINLLRRLRGHDEGAHI